MIIAIDGNEANEQSRVGVGRYAFELLRSLYLCYKKHPKKYKQLQFRIYLPNIPHVDMPKETIWWKYFIVTPPRLTTFLGLPYRLSVDMPKADVMFSPTHYIPRFTQIPRIMAIMDMSFIEFPKLFTTKDLYQLQQWTAWSVHHTSHIITISNFSKHAILKLYNLSESMVSVIYPGYTIMNGTISIKEIQKLYGISKHYILSVGTLQPRKNYIRLIEAFSRFLDMYNQPIGKVDLVIIGKKGWMYEEIFQAPERFGVQHRVKFLDFVPDEHLPTFYKHALTFALPSLYEGFGLPVLEAMAHSCPIVISNVSSLPEIAQKAGVYVDPNYPSDIARGLLTSVRQRNLKQGKYRINHGLKQVKKFSWEESAKKALSVLETIASKNKDTK
jgi:glycosyltransferase involved in cell wall biosynthesis